MKKALIGSLAAVVIGLVVRWIAVTGDSASEPALLFDRLWVDHMPRGPKDSLNVFAAVRQRRMGFFQAGSRWKGAYEVFNHKLVGDELQIVYLQTDEKEKVKVRAWRCKERGMDFCLELTGASRGVRRYGSLEGWEIQSTDVRELLSRVVESIDWGEEQR